MQQLTVRSPAFQDKAQIPIKYSCKGENINPPLIIEGIPEQTKSLALTVDDPDASNGFDHWVLWDISPSTNKIPEGYVPGIEGVNSEGINGYTGPCPPSGTHRYFFRVYAVDMMLGLKKSTTRKGLEKALQGHVLAKGELVGIASV